MGWPRFVRSSCYTVCSICGFETEKLFFFFSFTSACGLVIFISFVGNEKKNHGLLLLVKSLTSTFDQQEMDLQQVVVLKEIPRKSM